MDEVVFEQHLEEGHGTNTSNCLVESMWILLEIRNWFALDESLDKDGLACDLFEDFGKMDIVVPVEKLVELIKVILLYSEVELVCEGFCQRRLGNWKLKEGRDVG